MLDDKWERICIDTVLLIVLSTLGLASHFEIS